MNFKGKIFISQWNPANKVNIFGMGIKMGGRLPQGCASWIWEGLKNLGAGKIIKMPYISVQSAF